MLQRERPILFSGPLVRAILAGTKTVTRRPVKLHADEALRFDPCEPIDRRYLAVRDDDETEHRNVRALGAPFGAPGDRLWVRESFSSRGQHGQPSDIAEAAFVVMADGAQVYRDGQVVQPLSEYLPGAFDGIKWRPSIHLPRWASRILLEVTDVRVERLQEITEEDARAEGVPVGQPVPARICVHENGKTTESIGTIVDFTARGAFVRAWEGIYGSGSWDANGWVWRIAFKRVEVPRG